jgi:HTH-type transcriptional regulator/antitoxin HigA
METMTALAPGLQDHWTAIRPILTLRDETDYDRAVTTLNELLDAIGTDERHPLYDLLDTLGTVIAAYEVDHLVMPPVDGRDVLAYLIEEHDLRQSDLPEVGSQGIVSEILNGKRELNVRQIRALAARFGVSPAVFV